MGSSSSRFLYSYTISQNILLHFSSFSSFSSRSMTPESTAYSRSMLRPPSMATPLKPRCNACSFIGTIVSRVRSFGDCGRGFLRAFAFLKVKSDPRSQNSPCFCVCLRLQGKLAEISMQHLKLNDFIYVSGPLGSYEKLNASGQPEIIYKVFVQDLNYVRRLDQHCTTSMPVEPEPRELLSSPSGALREEMASESVTIPEKQHLERLHLWQLFFACPNEWWDNRQPKKNPSLPDFKHKDTKECLWLSPDDPPWVREQLQLYDAKMAGGSFKRDANILLDSYKWKFKDF